MTYATKDCVSAEEAAIAASETTQCTTGVRRKEGKNEGVVAVAWFLRAWQPCPAQPCSPACPNLALPCPPACPDLALDSSSASDKTFSRTFNLFVLAAQFVVQMLQTESARLQEEGRVELRRKKKKNRVDGCWISPQLLRRLDRWRRHVLAYMYRRHKFTLARVRGCRVEKKQVFTTAMVHLVTPRRWLRFIVSSKLCDIL